MTNIRYACWPFLYILEEYIFEGHFVEGLFKEGIFWNIVELCGHKLERLILMGHVLGGYVSLIIKSSNFWSFLKIIFFYTR